MSPIEIGFIGVGILFLLLFAGIPIGFAMGVVGIGGVIYLAGVGAAFGMLRTVAYTTFSNYGLTVIPLFLLMGQICYFAGISAMLYHSVYTWLGHLRGGLAMATIGACAGFAAVSGSSTATVATMGTVALPEMRRYNYSPQLATGCIAAGGGLGILIPPSVILIVYGLLVEEAIGELFIAGIFPGLCQAFIFMAIIYLLCRLNPALGPKGPATSFRDKVVSLKDSWIVVVLFIIVMGGIYLGIFSPTEAAAVGAFGALIFALARRKLNWQSFTSSLLEAGKTTAMIFLIVLGANFLGYFLAITRLPQELVNLVTGLTTNTYVVMVLIIFMYAILGCFMEGLSMMLLTIPIIFPLVTAMGFDPIWFGVMIVLVFEMGLITPPVGINVFVIAGIAQDTPMYTIFRGIIPFFIGDICLVALVVIFPNIVLFLPNLM